MRTDKTTGPPYDDGRLEEEPPMPECVKVVKINGIEKAS